MIHSVLKRPSRNSEVESTARLEAFSDGVFSIIITLLILEIHVPALHEPTGSELIAAFIPLIPHFVSYAVSFFTIAIFWVNHHHFFANIKKMDWKLMWANIVFLFWLAIIPFTTSLMSDYHSSSVAVASYAFILLLGVLSFMWAIYHAFFNGDFLKDAVSDEAKRKEFKRGMFGAYMYVAATILAFVSPYLAFAILIINPILFVVPRLIKDVDETMV